jgi:tetratricopeptide (TPR) repeat protein
MARNRSKRSLLILLPALALASWLVSPPSARASEADDLTRTVLDQYAAGNYQSAIPLAQRALELEEKAWGPDHPNVATALNNLASLYRYSGQPAVAESLYRRALDIDERAFGPAHAQVARDLSNLASLYYSQKRYADAKPLYQWALATDEKALGPDHPDVATDLNNLAALYESQNRHGDAQPLRERARAIQENQNRFTQIANKVSPTLSPTPPAQAPAARVGPVAAGTPPSPAPPKTRVLAPSSEQPLSCEATGAEASRGIEDFLPWPPPKGSDGEDVTARVLNAIGPKQDILLGDINDFLSRKFSSVKLPPSAYFSTPDHKGYAAVTRLEQIDDDGRRLEGNAGFSKELSGSGNFLWRFFSGLVTLPEGHFRLLVAFVTPDSIDTRYSSDPVTLEVTDRWISKGCDDLPTELAKLSFTSNYKVFLRVYQIASRGADSHLVSKAEAIPLAKDLLVLGINLDDPK